MPGGPDGIGSKNCSNLSIINDLSLTIFYIIQFLVIRLRLNFAHATTALLSWHMQNLVAILPLQSVLKQNNISIKNYHYNETALVQWPLGPMP